MNRYGGNRAKGLVINPRERLAREEGTIVKDWGGRLPIALVYPNSYYIGMSNLGLHVLYSLLNQRREIVCERVFWERENREKKMAEPKEEVKSLDDLLDQATERGSFPAHQDNQKLPLEPV